ncbi:MAG: hypothetical protein ACOX3H_01030 [Saccharofermentanales bacterium]
MRKKRHNKRTSFVLSTLLLISIILSVISTAKTEVYADSTTSFAETDALQTEDSSTLAPDEESSSSASDEESIISAPDKDNGIPVPDEDSAELLTVQKAEETEAETLISETEVNTFLVRFYDQDDTLLHEVSGVKGSPVEKPVEDPQQEGCVFSYWYLVDKHLQGDDLLPYDFEQKITGLTYLKAKYLPEQEDPIPEDLPENAPEDLPENASEDLPGDTPEDTPENLPEDLSEDITENTPVDTPVDKPEDMPEDLSEDTTENAPEDTPKDLPEDLPENLSEDISNENPENSEELNIEQKAVVRLSVKLSVEGEEIQDGAYRALLTGSDLPEAGVAVSNEGEKFPFPELVFTAEDAGIHVFQIEALVEDPLPLHTYDLSKHEVRVEIIVEEDNQVTARVNYPQGADHLLIAHSVQTNSPTVRVYVNLKPGQIIDYGDEVIFTAKMENCGESPRIQWQYSSDNRTWTDIAGADDTELSVLITPSNATGYWRVSVTVTD